MWVCGAMVVGGQRVVGMMVADVGLFDYFFNGFVVRFVGRGRGG